MSLRELWNVRRAAEARHRDEHDRDVILAWQIERVHILSMRKDGGWQLPSLKTLLQRGPVKAQTPDELVLSLYAISEQYGIPMTIEHPKGKN